MGGGIFIAIISGGTCMLVILLVKKTRTGPNGKCIYTHIIFMCILCSCSFALTYLLVYSCDYAGNG